MDDFAGGLGSSGGARSGWLRGDGPVVDTVCEKDRGEEVGGDSLVRALDLKLSEETLRLPPEVRLGEGEEKTSSESIGMVFGLGPLGLSFALVDGRSPATEVERLNGLLLTSSTLSRLFSPILLFGVRLVYRTSGESFSLLPDTFRSPDVRLSPETLGKTTLPFSFDTFLCPPLGVLVFGRVADIPSPMAAFGVAGAPVEATPA